MLGNFSFGDYFKTDAIRFAWEFVTGPVEKGCLALDPERIWVTVFEGAEGVPADTEAEELWKTAGVRPDRILRFGKKDNFWQMGDTGPCGPCSEMHYYRPKDLAGNRPDLVNGEGDDIMEIWNLVFMQYERDARGVLTPLPKPSIDTGMGLERTASILQGVESNYEIDLFLPIFRAIALRVDRGLLPDGLGNTIEGLRHLWNADNTFRTASQVVADHIRAATFMCYDGVVPSNEGRGYVMRKIIRRALRFGLKLGISGRFFSSLVPSVIEAMGDQYPELVAEGGRIEKVLDREERQFSTTLTAGLRVLEGLDLAKGVSGGDIFRLYDTFGFPVDLVTDWARERGIPCDLEGFQRELAEQKAKSRAAMKQHDLTIQGDLAVLADLPATEFLGYHATEAPAHVLALFDAAHRRIPSLEGEGFVLLDRTPFYAASGGQVGDTGTLLFEGGSAQVLDTTAPAPRRSLHKVRVAGTLRKNMAVNAGVNAELRARIRAHHTATHLLHAALREVLGTHVKQAGSVVDANRLRFDFTHFAPLEPEQVAEIERLATAEALRAQPTHVEEMGIEEALQSGAMALFGEKYGETVRVVQVPGFSTELCGGTHVANTGEIGAIKILSEGAVAAGVRRIEAVAGLEALARFQEGEQCLGQLGRQLNAKREDLSERIQQLETEAVALRRELREAKLRAAGSDGDASSLPPTEVDGTAFLPFLVQGLEGTELREWMDQQRARNPEAVLALFSVQEGAKVAALVSVPRALCPRFQAGSLLKAALHPLDGRGGGKPDLAQGGGTKPEAIPQAWEALLGAARG
jgi:alanyl-tRNA synthetase